MENPSNPLFYVDSTISEPGHPVRGIWLLGANRLVRVGDRADLPAVVLVPSEHVLVLSLEMPPMSVAARRAALPFAVEDRIADPLDRVHVALGGAMGANRWLAGIVRHELMQQWIGQLSEAGLDRAAIVPDALALPVPSEGSCSVDLAAGRATIRAADGTGFAVSEALLEAAWRAAGEPECIVYGDPLPLAMQPPPGALASEPLEPRLLAPALDLRQGRYAVPRAKTNPLWRRIAAVAAIGAVAHGAIAVADTLALDHIAAKRDADVRALAGSLQPGLVIGPDLAETLGEMTPDAAANAPSPFLSLLSSTSAALAASQTRVGWRSANYDGAAATLTIEVETDDIGGLQRVAQALTKAGLAAQPGAASTDQGHAVGTFAVRAS